MYSRKKLLVLFILVSMLLLIAAVIYLYIVRGQGRNTLPPQYLSQLALPASSVHKLDHIVIIVEENKPLGSIIGNTQSAPYINSLVAMGSYATNYYAVTNPSLPNYLALTSGTTAGITNDCDPLDRSCVANVSNITDRLEAAGLSWKMYAESMPSPCSAHTMGSYAVKHNPFLYYPDIIKNASRCSSHIVPFSDFAKDLQNQDSLPNYVFISPNLCNDMHDCSIEIGDTWLHKQVHAILQSDAFTKQHSLLVIVWDEADASKNNVPVIFLGPDAKNKYVSRTYFSHYSLLHTIEYNWRLKPLTTQDGTAPLMNDMLIK
jgi:phospholipase C